jgi:hypothetical protein
MSEEKRSVHTDALATLGTIIDDSQKRDAIHLAVEPVIAAEQLYPGQHIGFVKGLASTKADKKLGIVDPFISGFVPEGESFWLIIYPRQITSLRHVWSHPDFAETPVKNPELPPTTPKEESQKWINDFADRIRQHPQSLMDAAHLWIEQNDYTYDNSETYKEHYEEFPIFWKHFEVLTGLKPSDPDDTFFTCSC